VLCGRQDSHLPVAELDEVIIETRNTHEYKSYIQPCNLIHGTAS
jgi:hypothetical protein